MTTVTQPLHEEHQELLPQVERLRAIADFVGEAPLPLLKQGLDEVYDFLMHHLIPHAQAEEHALYPAVQKVMGAPEATRTMARDHVEIGRLTDELGMLRAELLRAPVTGVQIQALRRVLYGLYALLKLHFAKEEEVYLPLLDARLSPAEARQMFAALEFTPYEAWQRLA